MKRYFPLLFVAVFALGAFFRLWQLDNVPPSPSLDEVSIGYNAYSILKTGRDEYGYTFPLLLRAYDDWRPALYVYSVIPFLPIFGLSTIAVRLPAAFLGILVVVGTYFLVKELMRNMGQKTINNKQKNRLLFTAYCPLFSAALLAISPWHIYVSRLGHEVNLGLALVVWATLLFTKARFVLSGIFFALSLYSYQSEKIITPLIVLALILLYKKKALVVGVTALLVVIPLVWATITSPGLIRFQGTSVLGEKNSGAIVFSQYLSHFSPQWLFAGALREAHKVPNLGLFYLWEAPLIALGLFFLWQKKVPVRTRWLILAWILAAPLPGAITTQAPHAMRSYTFLPMLQVLGGLGLVSMKKAVIGFLFVVPAAISLVNFSKQYFDVFPREQSDSFQYALGQSLPVIVSLSDTFDQVIVSNENNLYQSYMFYLFYSRFDPREYQRLGGTVSGGYAETHTIGKLVFRPIDWSKDQRLRNTLLVGNVDEFPPAASAIREFSNRDGSVAIRAVSTK